jgi:predicted O-methyltransferase YrrM
LRNKIAVEQARALHWRAAGVDLAGNEEATMPGVLGDETLEALLDELYAQGAGEDEATGAYFRGRAERGRTDFATMDDEDHAFWRDKLVALERDRAETCYLLCRALQARRVVEVGTSFGVSTLFLAAAVRDNGGGTVIATEYEPSKAAAARVNFARAGLTSYVDLREGDVAETLRVIEGPVDFALFDIWGPAVRPALTNIMPHLRAGAIMVADNTGTNRAAGAYGGYFDIVNDPANGFRTLTLPFGAAPFAFGLELTVKVS